ncbi:hypothetical protein ES703_52921 [subsurface metagenome]
MKRLGKKEQISAKNFFGQKPKMAETSESKQSNNRQENYLSGWKYLKPGSLIWVCTKKSNMMVYWPWKVFNYLLEKGR